MSDNMLKTACKQFVDRAKTLEYKGKARDRAAIDYLCGFAAGLYATQHAEADHVARCIGLIIAVRGYSEVHRIAHSD